ncbi:S41 family peptidase [Paenibacillus protaetiae]|uniref:PDZ domain-containing protein n=1 Tax=Paenibacillus protaetiae TaxID=2509456 RepID=A0A4P6F132_9BACL|nr:S41 family peptidase [Paenibacillus protaetiae]QAY66727.1 PDZ domain-containing protein [Paenibacillus protaetiae]
MNGMIKEKARQNRTALAVIGAAVCVIIGFILCWLLMTYKYPMLKEPAFQNFTASYHQVMNDYLDGAKAEDLINGASEGMLASLGDPYSKYMSGELGEAYTQGYKPDFSGVGAEVSQEGTKFVIQKVVKDTPAEKGGVLPYDVITAVDNTPVEGKTLQQLTDMLRGEKGTKVKLTLQRPKAEKPVEIELTRDTIPVVTVTSEMLPGGIGHVTISKFADKTADEFNQAIDELQKDQPLKGLLLDLRSNPGGLLTPTIDIANKLVPKGKEIVQVVYKDEKKVYTYKSNQKQPWTVPIVVLVNGQSASASEVLTAALKESAGAKVIGEKTFGKGIVQQFRQFKDGSVLSLTEAQWKSPNGEWIHKKGIEPDETVKLPDYAYLPYISGTDLKQGAYGDDVKTIQTLLSLLGYSPVGDAGYFSGQTADALRAFQAAEGLDRTGVYDSATAHTLMDTMQQKLKQEDTQLQQGLKELEK